MFSISTWLLCGCYSICLCSRKGIVILLPFIGMLSVIANLLIGQYCLTLCSTSPSLCSQPCIICTFIFYRWMSSCVAIYMSSVEVYSHTFINLLMGLIFMLIPVISWSLFLCGCSGTTSLQCLSLGQICI